MGIRDHVTLFLIALAGIYLIGAVIGFGIGGQQ